MLDVITIGSTTYDSFLKVNFKTIDWDTPSKKAYAIPLGEKFPIDYAYFTMGGNAANASVTFANQNLKTAVFTLIGHDAAGHEIISKLRNKKVNTDFVHLSKSLTAHGIILLGEGERTILSYRGAVNEFSLDDIDWKKLKSKWLYVSLPGNSYKLFDKLLAHAKKNKIKVALNPGGKHLSEGREDLIRHLKDLSVLVLNESEAATLTGIDFKEPEKVFAKLDLMTPGIAVVTDGPNGVKVSDGAHIYEAGTFKEKEIVDRTGAGDAFGSGFVSGLVSQKEECLKGKCNPDKIRYAIRLASANATSNVEYIGATEGLLSKKQFETDPRWRDFEIKVKEV